MKNVTESLVGVAFARGLAMSELGSTGATWRPAITMQTPTQVQTHAYAAAAPLSAIAALPTVKTNVPTTKQHLVKTDAGRDNRPTEGPSSRRIPV